MRDLILGLVTGCAALHAAAVEPLVQHAVPAEVAFGLERVRLPGGEAMGLLGSSYLLEAAPGWWVGPALYGAATGHRGGLFTWGVEAQHRWALGGGWQLAGGVYAGGGGGANAPVGGGLMLRPHADLMFDFGGVSAGLAVSRVDFPSGDIRSTQVGLRIAVSDVLRFAPAGHDGQALRFDRRPGLGIDHLALAGGRYATVAGLGAALDYVNVQAEWDQGPVLSTLVQAGAAVHGGADGYAEFGAGLRALWPLGTPALRWGVQGSLGLGGGGGVAMGGGTLGKLGLVARVQPGDDWSLELQAGRARAFSGDFGTRYVQLSLGLRIDGRGAPGSGDASPRPLHETEWAAGVEHYLHAQRRDGSDGGISAVSLEVRRSLQGPWFVSARAVSAISGGAGAYSAGLLGLGLRTTHGGDWSAGIEAAAGAGGGGGISSSGGAIVEPLAWVGRSLGRLGRIKLGAGYVKSLQGDLASPVVNLAWALPIDTP